MLIGSSSSLFVESANTEEQGHNSQFISDDLSRVIEIHESNGIQICGAVTDNTSTNKLAWKIVQQKHPTMFFQGCYCHALHLLVKIFFGATKSKRGRPASDYPNGYPFEYILKFTQNCKDMVSFFSYHHHIKAMLALSPNIRRFMIL